jgi:hypothetical protein
MTAHRVRRAVSVILAAAATGCLTDTGFEPATITLVADGQQLPGGSRLPLRVTAQTEDGGAAVRAEVLWFILEEPGQGGSLSDSVTLSDGTGVAEVELTLGRTEGVTRVQAVLRAEATQSVEFAVTATRTPSLIAVSPASFAGGDQVVVSGTNLDVATGFDIGGAAATPVTVVGDGSAVTLVVPRCLLPGAVEIGAYAGTAVAPTISGDFTAAAGSVSLGVGSYLSLSPLELEGCATFPAVGASGAEYLLAVQSASGFPGETADYRLRGIGEAPEERGAARRKPARPSPAQRFHDRLRAMEQEWAQLPPVSGEGIREAPTGIIKVGVERVFSVCPNVSCEGTFATVRAKAKYVGTHSVIYQDVDAPDDGFSSEAFGELGELFDAELYEVGTRAFGAESDLDGDGRVSILLTPIVNSLTEVASCEESFISGFFLALDIIPAAAGDERSNQAEVFYSIVPDPQGTVSCDFTVDQVRRQIPVTFIHEFQHMISFHQHVLLRGGSREELWLNEGLSHLAEELAADHFLALGDQDNFNLFAVGNLINAYDYLLDPGLIFAIPGEGTGTREERGAAWLFLRWVVDRFGDDVVRRMAETGSIGAENVTAAVGVPFDQLLSQWFLANWVSDLPDSILADADKPVELTYSSWAFRTTFESFHTQAPGRFSRVFPLVPSLLAPSSFNRLGTLLAGSGDYFLVVQPANDPGFTATLEQPSGQPLVDAVPRLNVVRIR